MNAIVTLCAYLILFPLLFGIGTLLPVCGSFRKRSFHFADVYVTGGIVGIGLAEAAHLISVSAGWSFCDFVKWFRLICLGYGALCCFIVLVFGGFYGIRYFKKGLRREREKKFLFTSAEFVLAVLLLVCIVLIFLHQIFMVSLSLDRDMTLETVQTFLATDKIYSVNPLTGNPYELGIPSRIKILCIPSLYGALSQLSDVDPVILVWKIFPLFVMAASLLAFWSVGKALWPTDRRKRLFFLIIVTLLFYVSDGMLGQTGFGLVHQGFSPQTIKQAVLIPYLFGLLLRKDYRLVVFPLAAEVCICWTFYGLGTGVLMAICFVAVRFVVEYRSRKEEVNRYE